MKTGLSAAFILETLACFFGSMYTVSAQNYAILRSFSVATLNPITGFYTNSDGEYPTADLILSGQTLYGVTTGAGTGGSGTIFKINENGSGFTNLHNFPPMSTNSSGAFTNSEGAQPFGRLFLADDGTLYGAATYGGTNGDGTVFKIYTNGTGFKVIKTFTNGPSDGANPRGGMVMPDTILYGTTELGGTGGLGTVFKLGTNGTGFAVIHSFNTIATNGNIPEGTLLRAGATLYGTTRTGGASGWGTVYSLNTNGTGFKLVKSFSAASTSVNGDGAHPLARLALQQGVLYGTTYDGGSLSNGVVFRVDTDGTSFTNLYNFSGGTDGGHPGSRLVFAGDTLYGTTEYGGDGSGVIFLINADGSGFLRLRTFASTNPYDGRVPVGGLLLSGATFFGTTQFGGTNSSGTIFRYQWQPTPPVTLARSKTNVILSWPADEFTNNAFTFTLESTPNLAVPAWNAVTNDPVIVNGKNTVTNVMSGVARLYRLSPY